ncbi:STAS/SEC14 domain-containing protein [Chitinimonas koreensis]|uniref:STAS/SEC14 domain-containing protein n=1 Tax=Chitinimonas koreensis TaxID=356302 RepID=UPI0003F5F211|nr:STAS/SEC14 domain-containing protein [Chitinimonas koreensis]QNM95573.1 STAS/SEC14 domain-containing protein [Chitinimonas koreensis]
MIAIEHKSHCVLATVAGEFTLADYKEFEENVLYELQFHGRPNLLIDLTEMLDYTLDVVWEEIKFSRAHRTEFGRIAVITTDQWTTWATWLARLFVDSEVRIFDNGADAERWLVDGLAVVDQC